MTYIRTSTARVRDEFPLPYGAAFVAALLVSLAYAVVTMQIGLRILGVVSTVSLGVFLFAIYLLYRLVVAVERIADET